MLERRSGGMRCGGWHKCRWESGAQGGHQAAQPECCMCLPRQHSREEGSQRQPQAQAHLLVVAERGHCLAGLRGGGSRGRGSVQGAARTRAARHTRLQRSALRGSPLRDRPAAAQSGCRWSAAPAPPASEPRGTGRRSELPGGGRSGEAQAWAGTPAVREQDSAGCLPVHAPLAATAPFSAGAVVCRCTRRRSSASTLALHSPWGWICGGGAGRRHNVVHACRAGRGSAGGGRGGGGGLC